MKEIFKFIKPYRKKLFLVAFMHAAATISSLLMPYVMSMIVDKGIKLKNENVIITSAVFMTLLAVLSLVTSIVSNRINASVTTGFSSSVCKAMFKKINSLSFEQYSRIGSSGLLTRSTDDIFNIEGAASELVYTVVTVPMMLIGGAALSFMSDTVLSLVFLISIPPVFVFISFLVKPLYAMWEMSDKYIDEQNRIVRERLSGLRVIRAFNNEEKEHKRAKFATEEMAKYIIKSNVRSGYITPVAMLFLNLATVAILWAGVLRVQSGAITDAGDIIAVIQYVALISNAVIALSWTIAWIPHLKVSVKRIGEILTMPKQDDSADDEIAKTYSYDDGAEIEIRDLSFKYPDSKNPTLTGISMKIKKGETAAVIGGTGSGKSTLIRLLLNFYDADSGCISINGTPYTELSKGEIRSAYSPALQRAMIFEGTLKDNIMMGKRSATLDEVMKVISDCELAEFLDSHKEGLDYGLVGLGHNVSGGQKQRINMARTVIREAPVYIFDDSFSALDYLTERKIQKALFKRLSGKTKIIITQRVSTALASEHIFVMDKGSVVADGTHTELIRKSDIYREICISQLGADTVKEVLDRG